MKIYRSLSAIVTISITTILGYPSVADVKTNIIEAQNFRNSIGIHQCQQPSKIPLPDSYKQIEFKQNWCGTIPKELRKAAPAKGYIANDSEWSKLWKTYRSNEALPKIDFDRELILLYVHFDANSVEMIPAIGKGDLAVNVAFTEAGMADTPCTYMFVSIDRRGIKTIDGKPIVNKSERNAF
jgi:hypothetical protein